MHVTLLDYGMGNLRSVQRALEAAGATVERSERLRGADRVVLPGVGAFAQACARLRETGAWEDVQQHLSTGRPLLGICLGMQLLFEGSEEHGDNAGFGAFPGRVVHLSTQSAPTVPNMGWHRTSDGAWAYFAHSYGVPVLGGVAPLHVRSTVTHGGAWVAAAQRGALHALQFHPEKSGAGGIARLKEWLAC